VLCVLAVLAVATNALYYDAGSASATATASATAQACEHTTEQHAALQSTVLTPQTAAFTMCSTAAADSE
jgi:Tfp pilus assembly protein PilE